MASGRVSQLAYAVAALLTFALTNSAQAYTYEFRIPEKGLLAASTQNTAPSQATLSTSGPLNFGSIGVSSTATQYLTLTNSGNAAATSLSVTLDNNQYAESNNCGTALAAGSSCTVSVTYDPYWAETENTTLQIASANGGSFSVPITGTGIEVTWSATTWPTFTNLPVGQSATQSVTVTNTGNIPATPLTVTSENSPMYTETDNCGTALAAGASCTINVTFTPTSTQTTYGWVQLSSSALNGNYSFEATGTGSN